MSLEAGDLRHRVRIERLDFYYDSNDLAVQDPVTGETPKHWIEFKSVWASIKPLSAREFIQSAAMQSQVMARITIRNIDGLDPAMRIVHLRKGRPNVIYNTAGFLSDAETGLEYITIPVSAGVNDG